MDSWQRGMFVLIDVLILKDPLLRKRLFKGFFLLAGWAPPNAMPQAGVANCLYSEYPPSSMLVPSIWAVVYRGKA